MPLAPAVWVCLALIAAAIGGGLGVAIEKLPQIETGTEDSAPAGPIHPWVEIAAVLIALLAAWRAGSIAELVSWSALGFILLPLAWLDARHFWLPDIITLPGILAGLALCWWIAPADLPAHAAGAAAGFLSLALVGAAYRRLRGRDGLGLGDAKLLALAGAWTGWQDLGAIIVGAALLGIGIALLERMRGNPISATTRIPLGTCMAPFIFLAAIGIWP